MQKGENMTFEEAFDVLAIAATKDESLIKQAYRMKLMVTNPEDNPEGFKRLRQAYETACKYAAQTEEETKPEEEDNTPSGQWISKADGIYNSISRRRDLKEWQQLFEDDIVQSLEGEEECRRKLLAYLMSHFYFPAEIWRFFDEKLRIQEDNVRLKEIFPADFINFVIRKCSGESDIDFELFEGADDAPYDRYIQCYMRSWQALDENNTELAMQLIDESEKLGIFHPVMEVVRAEAYVKQGNVTQAVQELGEVYKKYPDDLTVAYNYANICWNNNLKDKAAEVYIRIKEKSDKHYMANLCLAEWYFERKDYENAKSCAEEVMAIGSSDDFAELVGKINTELEKEYNRKYTEEGDIEAATELAWCYLQDGSAFAGIKLAESINDLIQPDKYTSHLGLLTKLYLEEAMYEEAVQKALEWRKRLFDEFGSKDEDEQKKDRSRICQTYAIRAKSFHLMGYADKNFLNDALKEIDELFALPEEFAMEPNREIPILFEKVQVYIDMGEPEKAVELSAELVNDRQIYGSYLLMMDAYSKMWDAGGVIAAGRQCINYFPKHSSAYEEIARVYHDLKRSDDLKEILKLAKDNGIESVLLDAYEDRMKQNFENTFILSQQVRKFDSEYMEKVSVLHKMSAYYEGYPVITQMLYDHPGVYMLIQRGLFSLNAKDYEKALKDFEKALEIEPSNQFALNNIGCIYKYMEEHEKAIVYFKRAIRYMDEEPNAVPYINLAHTYERMGAYDFAAETREAVIKRFPDKRSEIRDGLMIDYARCRQIEKASEYLDRFTNLEPAWKKGTAHMKVYDMYVNADMTDKALDALNTYYNAAATEKESSIRSKMKYKYKRTYAWNCLVSGRYLEAIKNIKEVLDENDRVINHEYIEDVAAEVLFMLSIQEDALRYEASRAYGIPLKSDLVFEESGRIAANLLDRLNVMTKNGDDFFYKERELQWKLFLISYFTEGFADNEEYLEALEDSIRCTQCKNPSCAKLKIARAMLLEKRRRKEEALDIYKELQKEQPYDWYSKAKVFYLTQL